MDLSKVRRVLFNVTSLAGNAALAAQNTTQVIKDTGGGGGITTQADLDTERIIFGDLHEAFPNIAIIGEEYNDLIVCPEEAFIVDPIDGTAPYKAGADFWTTTIAYSSPTGREGAIYRPVTGQLYVTNKDRVEVYHQDRYEAWNQSELSYRILQPLVARRPQWNICAPITREFSDLTWRDVLQPLIIDSRVRSIWNVACNTVHFLMLFEGYADGVIMYAKTWDSAAAIAMAQYLNVIITDFQGNQPDLSVINPQRLVFARGYEVLDCILGATKNWPAPEDELRV